MSRKRLTNKVAADTAFGQSANEYWRSRALEAVKGALSEVEREIMEQAQKLTQHETAQLGVPAPQYAPQTETKTEVDDAEEPVEQEPVEQESQEEEEMNRTASKERVFEPKKTASEKPTSNSKTKTAGEPFDPASIGIQKWREVERKFPQYVKQPQLTMLAVAPTKMNQQAMSAVTETLDRIASSLEESGDNENALRLDVVSELLTASVEESLKNTEEDEETE